jgi:hypothetical protein
MNADQRGSLHAHVKAPLAQVSRTLDVAGTDPRWSAFIRGQSAVAVAGYCPAKDPDSGRMW